jgi:nucleoside-diphosphate-sugar epimerase
MKILVIGASGYIGSHVAAAFADAGHEVFALHSIITYLTA